MLRYAQNVTRLLLVQPDVGGVAEAEDGNGDEDGIEVGEEGVEPGADGDADGPHAEFEDASLPPFDGERLE